MDSLRCWRLGDAESLRKHESGGTYRGGSGGAKGKLQFPNSALALRLRSGQCAFGEVFDKWLYKLGCMVWDSRLCFRE